MKIAKMDFNGISEASDISDEGFKMAKLEIVSTQPSSEQSHSKPNEEQSSQRQLESFVQSFLTKKRYFDKRRNGISAYEKVKSLGVDRPSKNFNRQG